MPSKVEQIAYRSMSSHKSLCLLNRLELTHPALSHPSGFLRLLSPIILILLSTVGRLWHHLPVGNWIATKFIRHDLSGLAPVTP